MYTVYADGELMYTPALSDDGYALISPTVTKEVNKAGSMKFTMTETHPFYNRMHKLKTMITVFNDGKEVFRGRVMSAETDFYKRKNVYCEGELAFLNDTVVKAFSFSGTAAGFFKKLINDHNESVEGYAQFTIGTVDVTDKIDIEETIYTNTFQQIQNLIDAFGGYITIRESNGRRVIDYRENAESVTGQKIEFGVNMLDLTEKITAEDVYTVVIPIGKENSKTKTHVNISSVNGGWEYIQNDAAVAMFGKIWRVYEEAEETSPSELLKKARKYLKKGIEEAVTMTISAVDLHIMDVDTEQFDTGKMVRVVSYAHGIDADYLCSAITLDIVNPEQNKYTFGVQRSGASGVMANAKAKAENAKRSGGSAKKKADQNEEDIYKMGTDIQQNREHIKLLAWSTIKQGSLSTSNNAFINMSAEEILAEVSKIDTDDIQGVVNSVKSSISQTAGSIISKVEKNGVISAINQTAESITIQASKINLSGYVTASQLSAVSARIDNLISGTTSFTAVYTGTMSCTSLKMASENWSTSGTVTITVGSDKYRVVGKKL